MPRAVAVILFAIISVSSLFVITGFSSEPVTTSTSLYIYIYIYIYISRSHIDNRNADSPH